LIGKSVVERNEKQIKFPQTSLPIMIILRANQTMLFCFDSLDSGSYPDVTSSSEISCHGFIRSSFQNRIDPGRFGVGINRIEFERGAMGSKNVYRNAS
jgi:hypothetical protein